MSSVKITIEADGRIDLSVTQGTPPSPRGPTDTDMLREALGIPQEGTGLHNDEIPGR